MLPNILNIDSFRGNYCKDFKVRFFFNSIVQNLLDNAIHCQLTKYYNS